MKKRGFGFGKWNGVGGKVKVGETIKEATVREMEEEIGVSADIKNLKKVGNIKFFFSNKPADWNQDMSIFLVENWKGEPAETEEMKPEWYDYKKIPFRKMWSDDKYWLPKVLAGKKIKAEFYFKDEGNTFDKFEIKEV